MAPQPRNPQPQATLRVADLPAGGAKAFDVSPDAAEMKAIAAELGLVGLRKLRFTGQVLPFGDTGWQLRGHLGATVVQPCVVTLAPVTTRLEEDIERRFLPGFEEPEAGSESEMPDDVDTEPLTEVIDLGRVMVEALALALPTYPRAEGAHLDSAAFAEPGTVPMTDEEARPFAGLAGLRDKLSGNGGSDDEDGGENE